MTTKQLWQYVRTHNLWRFAKKCTCAQDCSSLQLTLHATATANAATREHVRAILRSAAGCVRSIAFSGAGCNELAQLDEMGDVLRAIGESECLQSVRFEPSVKPEHFGPLLSALESNKAFVSLACSIEAYVMPALPRLLAARGTSMAEVTIYVDDSAQFGCLRTAAAATAPSATVSVHISPVDGTTAQQLATELAAWPLDLKPRNWSEIRLLHCKINQREFEILERQCRLFGNIYAALMGADIPRERHGCLTRAHSLKIEPPITNRRDASLHNLITFTKYEPHHAPPGMAFSAVATVASSSTTPTPPPIRAKSATAVAPESKARRVRGGIAAHCQKGPAETAAQFAKAAVTQSDDNDNSAPAEPRPLCANISCVNRTIDDSEYHTELVCEQRHTIRVHNKLCETAALGSGGGGGCPQCGGTVGQRTQVRINEHGGRIVKPSTAAPPVAAAAAVATTETAPLKHKEAAPRKSKAAMRRERRAQKQVVAATEEPIKPAEPQHTRTPALAQPLVIDDSEHVRRLAAGQVATTRVQKAVPKPLLVKTKKAKQNCRPAPATLPQRLTLEQAPVVSDDNADDDNAPAESATNVKALSLATNGEVAMQIIEIQRRLHHLAEEAALLNIALEQLVAQL